MSGPDNGAARMHAANAGTTLPDADRPRTVAAPGETEAQSTERVEDLTAREIRVLLRKPGVVDRDKIASLKVAIAYLAVKNKLGSPFGGDLDNED